jgi:hypothetical protein
MGIATGLLVVGCLGGCAAEKEYACSCSYICDPPYSGGTTTDWDPAGIIKAEGVGQAESRAESLCDEQSATDCGEVVFEPCLCTCTEAD